jgi:hypothetical protein
MITPTIEESTEVILNTGDILNSDGMNKWLNFSTISYANAIIKAIVIFFKFTMALRFIFLL